jgi:ferritin-like metal-binding protein YciE
MNTLKNLFLDELADMYDSEHRILKALPKMIKAATCGQLQNALQHHFEETGGHVTKIERVFAVFDEKPWAKKCPAIAGILEEGEKIVSENKKSTSINAAIISAAQKVEHYEIASYGTLHAWAQLLENEDAARLIQEILDQEKAADRTLNNLSVSKNQEAFAEVEAGGLA